jgi:hypothetical protein
MELTEQEQELVTMAKALNNRKREMADLLVKLLSNKTYNEVHDLTGYTIREMNIMLDMYELRPK